MPALCPLPNLQRFSISVLTNLILGKLECLTQDEKNEEQTYREWENGVQKHILEHLQNIGAYEDLRDMVLTKLDQLFVTNHSLRPKIRDFVPLILGFSVAAKS